jgi:hypothetical protein
LGYFKQEITCVNSIVHIVGDSSSGKTTALKLGISVFGNPEIGANTLAGTWNATKNALLKRLMTVEGVTFGLDESSMFNGDMTKIIYEIGDGTDKERLTKEGNLKRKETGTYVVLSTGESGILCRSSKNNGLAVRAMEIHVEKWTESAEQSEKITEFVQNHYGRVAPAIAKWIENQDVKDLKTRYQEMRKFYSNISKMQGFKERVSIRMGLILLSAEVAKEAIGLDLSYKKICQFITDHEKQDMSTKNNFDDFYEKFKSFLFSHRKYFISGTGDSSGSGEYGSIDKSKFYDYNDEFEIPDHLKYLINDSNPNQRYFITPEKFVIRKRYFKEFVQKEGYEDDRRLLHHLKVKGLLETDEGRLTRKRKLCGSDKAKEEVYVIIIIDEEDDIAEVRELIELAKGNCKKRKQKFPCISRNARTTKENNKNRPLTG